MRVLIVSQYYWPEVFRISDLAVSLQAKNIDVEVLTGKPNYPQGIIFKGYSGWGFHHERHGEISVHRVPMLARGKGALRLALNYLSFIMMGLLCGPWLMRGKRFDVIFVPGLSPILQAFPALFLGWLKQRPVVLWVQDLWPESLSATGYVKNPIVLRLVESLVRFIYHRVDLLLVQSEAFVAPVSALAGATPVVYYPNSVDENFSAPVMQGVPTVEGLSGAFSVLFAGNIGSAQAVEVVVEAATLLNAREDIHFVVMGDGSRRAWMQEQVKVRGLNRLHLPGRFPVELMPAFMRKASVLLVSLKDEPIFAATIPNKVQAYMASGRPILACMNGEGARLVAAAGAGLAVPAEDGQALATAVLKLHSMTEEERQIMGDNGQQYYAEHFNHDQLVSQLITYFEKIIADKKGVA